MSIKFTTLNMQSPVKSNKQIVEEINKTLHRSYFYGETLRGEQADVTLTSYNYWGDDEFEDVPF